MPLLLAPLALLACSPGPQQADPALWKVEGPGGEKAWLFGTIHSSKRPLAWQTPAIAQAMRQSDTIMVEVANLADEADVAATFARLAKNERQPPLSRRVAADERPALAALLRKSGYGDDDFAGMDTWAAALTLARSDAGDDEVRNGVDRAIVAAAGTRPIIELEGAKRQLGLFDALPEADQRDLLGAVVADAARPETDLAASWRTGDMTAIEKETRRGLLADPELREVLFTRRNREWASKIIAEMKSGHLPFVAVGAAHMAGPQGVPAMLAERGYKVTRIE
ncbi:MAG TPA: TraB/GumN family protein [Novosphingobium sp.]|nr:TraB/GumN family protein [Novosphingobium sp.]